MFLEKYKKEIILFVGVILISLFSFAMGYIVAKQQNSSGIIIEDILERKTYEF